MDNIKQTKILERTDLTLAAYRWLNIKENLSLIEESQLYKYDFTDLLINIINNDEMRTRGSKYLVWYLDFKFDLVHEEIRMKEKIEQMYQSFIKTEVFARTGIKEGTEEDLLACIFREKFQLSKGLLVRTTKLQKHVLDEFETIDWYSSISSKVQVSTTMALIVECKNELNDLRGQLDRVRYLVDFKNSRGKNVWTQMTKVLKKLDLNIDFLNREYGSAFTMRKVSESRRQYVKPMMLESGIPWSKHRMCFNLLMDETRDLEEITKVLNDIKHHTPHLRLLSNDSEKTA